MTKESDTVPEFVVPSSPMDKVSWQQLMEKIVMPFNFDIPDSKAFEGRITSTSFLDTSLFLLRSESHAAERTEEDVQTQAENHCVVSFQLEGSLHLTQFGRRTEVKPGQFSIYTSDAPVRIEGSRNYHSLSAKIPLTRFSSRPEELHQFSATAYSADQGLAPAVQSFLRHLKVSNGSISGAARVGVSQHVVGMIEQMLRSQNDHRAHTETSADVLRERCLAYIESNLQNHDLSPQMIAEGAFISTRYLHQLFSQTDLTVARYIRKRRIERIREDLASPARALEPIEQIALRWGVQNVSYFGQVFKRIEGCTPAEFRRRALGQ